MKILEKLLLVKEMIIQLVVCQIILTSEKIDDCKDDSKMIAINLSNQQARDADPRAIQQINFTSNLDRAGDTTMFFITEDVEEQKKLSQTFCKEM